MWLSDGSIRKRRKAFEEAGHAHELTFSCFQKLPLLGFTKTRDWLIESMERVRTSLEIEIWAYVLMPDHVHLVFFPTNPKYSIARILQQLKQTVAQRAINHLRRTGSRWLDRLTRVGPDGSASVHFWQPGGGYDRNITSVETL
jgi:putative transposase